MYSTAKQKLKAIIQVLSSAWERNSSSASKKIFITISSILIGSTLVATSYFFSLQRQNYVPLNNEVSVDDIQPTSLQTSTPEPLVLETILPKTPLPIATLIPSTPRNFSSCASAYSAASPWNTKISGSIQYHPESNKFISSLSGSFGADPNQYTYPVYEVDSSTNQVKVSYSGVFSEVTANGQVLNRDSGGGQVEIPIPPSARASSGDDSQLIVVSTRTGEEWGLYEARSNNDGTWSATNGYKYNINWNGVAPNGFGSRGAGVTYLAGLIRKCEIEKGSINHAIAFGYDYPSPLFVYPATKSDGRGSRENDLPEGARLQLNPQASESEINGWCSGSGINTASCKIVVRALQEYGMIVVDGSGHPKIYAEDNKTANWGSLWSSKIPSKIPLSAFKVLNF